MKNMLITEIDTALEQQNLPLALSKVQVLIQDDPQNAIAYIRFGDIFMKMSNHQMAIEKYQQAIQLEPINADFYFRLGLAYAEQDRWSEACSNFKSASTIEPENLNLLSFHGWAQWHLGIQQNNKQLQQEAYLLLSSVYDQGIQTQPVKYVLAEYFIRNANATWPYWREEDCFVPTHYRHLQEARKSLDQARDLLDDLSSPLQEELQQAYAEVDHYEKREFYGYPYMRKAPIVVGVILFIFGNRGIAFFLFLLAALYHFSQFKPGYLANRKHLKGDYGDPFWVRRINEVGEFASQVTFFGPLTEVLFWGWIFRLLTRAFQYAMAIFMLPFLIVSGFVINYDLYNKAKVWIASQKQLQ